jgi:hypothetical protein
MNGRMTLGKELEQNRVGFTDNDPPFGKDLAVPRAEPRMAPTADMEGSDKAVHSTRALSYT